MPPSDAILLGLLEGLTEFLPVSSTGHLILASYVIGARGGAVKAFEVVIQSGAVLAVLGLYWSSALSMWRGALGRDPDGRRLLVNLLVSFLPAAVAGLLLHDVIKDALFGVRPVITALAAGGVVMIMVDRWRRAHPLPPGRERTLRTLTTRDALIIGVAQCLSLWPGMSRAMVTMLAGLSRGLSPVEAARYSFLLALPTLGAATALDMIVHGDALWREIGPDAVAYGLATAGLTAAVAITFLVRYLTRHGLEVFGWYRLGLAGAVWWLAAR